MDAVATGMIPGILRFDLPKLDHVKFDRTIRYNPEK